MNKLTLILFFGCVVLSVMAQHNITNAGNAYRAADQLVKQQVEFKDPGSSGKDLHWDFSMVQPINEDYKLDYFIPDSTQMNRLCGMEHNTRYYYLQHNDSLWATGFENSTTYMEYVTPELKLKFPFAYGDTLYTQFKGAGEYCHRDSICVKGYTRVIADAEGELKLPEFETVKKALRVRTLRHYTETGKDSVEMTLDTYSWYAAGIRYPVFESIKTTLSKKGDKKDELGESINDTTVFSTSFYYPPEKQISVGQATITTDTGTALTQDISSVFTEGQYMPNPVVDNLYITYKLTRPAKVWFTLHNNIGVAQCSTSPENRSQGYNTTTINMSGLMTGTYTLYVHVDDMVLRQVVVKK
ncbi:MAG: hypothetical protein PHR83_12750 [Paludibacter sp.]|nr:hypothetical protein [Paludibacter sp.]